MTDENGHMDISELAGIVRDINDSYLDGAIDKGQRDRQLVGAQAVLDSHGWTWDQLNDVIQAPAGSGQPAEIASDPAFPESTPTLGISKQQSQAQPPPPAANPATGITPPTRR